MLQLWAMAAKRTAYMRRTWWELALAMSIPLLFILLALSANYQFVPPFDDSTARMNLTMTRSQYGDTVAPVIATEAAQNISELFEGLLLRR